ncbi:uncharacterized protein BDZ99DRAFT_212108 [Mytilinidion resinicola]|uniref:Uncharacterized protein n=1 Tax=Mytilinidion resinicola TaxID=574789 RepID=A0A6A6Y001_9PEZI|nr:uncharacterized protein BDZ99DRAFT_212108 [Mytilinidion resinicola]KAF2801979.1 hypothetical protein BDZ99DRAFT_212108 [Mytilinidion resinicola]
MCTVYTCLALCKVPRPAFTNLNRIKYHHFNEPVNSPGHLRRWHPLSARRIAGKRFGRDGLLHCNCCAVFAIGVYTMCTVYTQLPPAEAPCSAFPNLTEMRVYHFGKSVNSLGAIPRSPRGNTASTTEEKFDQLEFIHLCSHIGMQQTRTSYTSPTPSEVLQRIFFTHSNEIENLHLGRSVSWLGHLRRCRHNGNTGKKFEQMG